MDDSSDSDSEGNSQNRMIAKDAAGFVADVIMTAFCICGSCANSVPSVSTFNQGEEADVLE